MKHMRFIFNFLFLKIYDSLNLLLRNFKSSNTHENKHSNFLPNWSKKNPEGKTCSSERFYYFFRDKFIQQNTTVLISFPSWKLCKNNTLNTCCTKPSIFATCVTIRMPRFLCTRYLKIYVVQSVVQTTINVVPASKFMLYRYLISASKIVHSLTSKFVLYELYDLH